MKPTSILLICFLLFPATIAICQEEAIPQDKQIEDLPRLDPGDLPEKYRKWLLEEVVYIITKAERESFLRITTNELRDEFIELFWDKRDPTPGTRANEFKDEHYRRIEYANKNFGPRGQKNGWRNDRGRAYIILGEPKEKLEFPNDSIVYPVELWFYAGENRIPTAQFFYLMFFQRGAAGDYVLYHPQLDGPERLTWKGRFDYSDEEILEDIGTVHHELALAAQGYDPMDPGNKMASEIIIAHVESWPERSVDGKWAEDFVLSDGKVDVTYSFKNLDTNTITMLHTPQNGRQQLHYAFFFSPSDLEIGQYEESYYAVLEVIPSLADKDGNIVFEDSATAEIRWTEKDYQQYRSKPLLVTDTIPVVPGDYNFTVRIRNKVSKNYFMFTRELKIPVPRGDQFFMTTPTLNYAYNVDKDGRSPSDPIVSPFKLFNIEYKPSSTYKFAPIENINVFTELYFPVGTATEKAVGDIRFTFNIYRVDELVKKLTHIIPKDKVNNLGIIYLNYPIPLDDLGAGEYRLEIVAEENKEQRNMVRAVPFMIDDPSRIPRPTILKLVRNIFRSDNNIILANADLLLQMGFTQQAIGELERVTKRNPDNVDSAIKLSKLLLKVGRSEDSFNIARRVESLEPNNRELVLLLARSSTIRGELDQAIKYYERLLFYSPDDTELLNSAGILYIQNGDSVKARERLEKSLSVDPEQPDIKRVLSELATTG